ncbi:hypothetical protein [Fangia hongkongensis]|uniref:hypothetical protein n=1 Tax=Fangia hongkongensis TaxID=270495 RepID=UPI0003715FF9|nr:hypothetical protein [Fangia hongkongensis]MBK2123739.1 hypothetical protein [Fangia hongkongensis]
MPACFNVNITQIKLRKSRLKLCLIVCVFILSLISIGLLLLGWLRILTLILWGVALLAVILQACYAQKISQIVITQTKQLKKLALYIDNTLVSDLQVQRRLLFFASTYFVVEGVYKGKKTIFHLWFCRDNFVDEKDRRALIRFLLFLS